MAAAKFHILLALDEIAAYLESDRDTHKLCLDRRFRELGIIEPSPEPSPKEETL